MHIILIIFLFFSQNILLISSHPVTPNPKARIVPELDIIYVEWQGSQGAVFTVRHKAENAQSWKYIRTSETNVRIPLDQYEESKNIQIQIKNERENTDWSKEIIIDNSKKMNSSPVQKRGASPIAVNPTQLQPPLQFNAKIIGPTNVQLKWQPVVSAQNDIYYLVNVKQLTTSSGSTLQNQQIKTAATSFTLGKMISGEKYEMTIRSATSQDKISQNAAIVEITMPRETEYFEIGNLIISSHFKTASQGVVNLTWQVPPTMQNRIMAYHVEYAESGDENNWQKIQFHGASSSAALNNLKSNTEYVLRIKTQLVNNIMTESGQFRFKTPRVETNPIQKVDVIYSHDINSVKLQWILKSHIQTDKVAGYDVYMSEDKDLPDSQWKVIRLNNKESSLSMDDLKSKTVYYVRVNVRNFDGSIIRAPSVYRFKTIDTEDNEEIEGNSLSYRNVAPGQVEIKWTYPKDILDSVIGGTVLYTNQKEISPDKWNKIEMEDSKTTLVNLQQLREGDRYYVQILPRLYTGDYDFNAILSFDFKVDRLTRVPYSPYNHLRPMSQNGH